VLFEVACVFLRIELDLHDRIIRQCRIARNSSAA
jgi:hypothetical protein